MALWNDRRTPPGHLTDTTTGKVQPPAWGGHPTASPGVSRPSGPGTWGHQPAASPVSRPTGPGTWGAPAHTAPVDNSRMMNSMNDKERARGQARDRAAAGAPRKLATAVKVAKTARFR